MVGGDRGEVYGVGMEGGGASSELGAAVRGAGGPAGAAAASVAGAGIQALLAALTARGLYDPQLASRVVAMATAIGREMGLGQDDTDLVSHVALLHDIGKIGMPASLLHKHGELDERERELLCEHTAIGAQIVASFPDLAHIAPAIRAKHERWDGTGYPDGLTGEEIPVASRITFACEAYHAMLADRPYRRGRPASPPPAEPEPVAPEREPVAREPVAPEREPVAREPVAPEPAVGPLEPELVALKGPARPLPPRPRSGAGPAAGRRGVPGIGRRRLQAAYATALVIGIGLGLLVALPLRNVEREGVCPPAHEGLVQCKLQKAWLPALTEVVAIAGLALLLVHVALVSGPRLWRRWRTGTLRRREKPPPFESDPVLRAATWGLTYEDANPGKARPKREWKDAQGRRP
jgi:hypothetical protein